MKLSRKIIAYKTTQSWTTVPHVSFVYQADASRVLATYERHKGDGITVNTILLKIIVDAIKGAPQVNAHIKYNRKFVTGRVVKRDEINISLPWLLDNGEMITINLRDFGGKSLFEMQSYIDKTRAKIKNTNLEIPLRTVAVSNHVLARFVLPKVRRAERDKYDATPDDNKITPHDLEVGTITVSNIGSLCKGIRGFMGLLEIIPPQVFAIGIGAIQDDNTISMCLAFDHRALNFSDVVPFIRGLERGLSLIRP